MRVMTANIGTAIRILIAVPIFAVITLIFRRATRRVYRDIRSSVSQLNQYLQENLSGIQIVQLDNLDARQVFLKILIQLGDARANVSINPPRCASKDEGDDRKYWNRD